MIQAFVNTCPNCLHSHLDGMQEPCRSCKAYESMLGVPSNWEPKKITADQKSCHNCLHERKTQDSDPCFTCDPASCADTPRHWEPKAQGESMPSFLRMAQEAGALAVKIAREKSEALGKAEAEKEKHDPVNQPSHYTQGNIEVIDFIEDQKLGYHAGNVIKYVARYRYKNGLEDLKKARWYLDRLIQLTESEQPMEPIVISINGEFDAEAMRDLVEKIGNEVGAP